MRWIFVFGMLLTCVPPASYCQGTNQAAAETVVPADEKSAEATAVQITGMRDPEWKPYKSMLKGAGAFEKRHSLAPSADLRFILLARRDDVDMRGLQLSLK